MLGASFPPRVNVFKFARSAASARAGGVRGGVRAAVAPAQRAPSNQPWALHLGGVLAQALNRWLRRDGLDPLRPSMQRAFTPHQFTLVHDAAVGSQTIGFIIPPHRATLLSVLRNALMGVRGFGESFEWVPSEETRVHVLDRRTLQVIGVCTLPGAPTAYHVINAYDETDAEIDGEIDAEIDGETDGEMKKESGGDESGRFVIHLAQLRGGDRAALERQFADMYSARFDSELQCAVHE